MAQIMKADHRQASATKERSKVVAQHIAPLEGAAKRIRKHQVMLLPSRPSSRLHVCLTQAMALQSLNRYRRERDCAPASLGLGRRVQELAAKFSHRRAHVQPATIPIKFTPFH